MLNDPAYLRVHRRSVVSIDIDVGYANVDICVVCPLRAGLHLVL